MLEKLKEKLRKWLFEDELASIRRTTSDIEHITNMADYAKDLFYKAERLHRESGEQMVKCIQVCEQLRDVCTPLLDVGTDIGFYEDHSWAVICVKGKPEYIKFIPMDGKDTRYLIEFLRQYQKSNNVIDSPLGFRHMLNREIFVK